MGALYCSKLGRSKNGYILMGRALSILAAGPTPEVNEQAAWCPPPPR
jgi:hypothetical protein